MAKRTDLFKSGECVTIGGILWRVQQPSFSGKGAMARNMKTGEVSCILLSDVDQVEAAK